MATILNKSQRPIVAFDPSDADHRAHFHRFEQTSTWSSCPVRFHLDDNFTNVVSMIHGKLLAHYTQSEFACV
jgi:hypothetical protein